MREILFRGKRLDNGEWVEGGYNYKKVGGYFTDVFIIEHLTDGVCVRHKVDPDTVGQYTGLCDKNGKKIFEGDIVERRAFCGDYVWEKCFLVEWNKSFPGWWEYRCSQFYSLLDGNCEVIGNIHDNPELLKGE